MAHLYLSLPEVQACDCLWVMGIWQPSSASIQIARNHEGLNSEFRQCLNDLKTEDIIGSPYSIHDYIPNQEICESWEDLTVFKETLNQFGKKLILDFVPNHLAVDSPWIHLRPTAFLTLDQSANIDHTVKPKDPNTHNQTYIPKNYFQHESGKIYAHGRDPYFDGWTDTVQFDFSSQDCINLHNEILSKISEYCDGLRCDMAMLPVADIFEKTHGKKGLPYWEVTITKVRNKIPDFLFIAEVYWNREYDLQQLGFNFTYDKELYDRLKSKNPTELIGHLSADLDFQNKSLRFLENHDEPRAMQSFGQKSIFDFSLLSFLPGGLLIHEDQKNGFKKRIPVQLGRGPIEQIDSNVLNFYKRALQKLSFRKNKILKFSNADISIYGENNSVCIAMGIEYDSTGLKSDNHESEILIYNPNSFPISGRIRLDPKFYAPFIKKDNFTFLDVMDDKLYRQDANEIHRDGIYFYLMENKSHWMIPLKKE